MTDSTAAACERLFRLHSLHPEVGGFLHPHPDCLPPRPRAGHPTTEALRRLYAAMALPWEDDQ